MPISVALVLIVAGIVRKKATFFWVAFFFLYLTSTPFVADRFFGWVEKTGGRCSSDALKNADAIVVLSGMKQTISGRDSLFSEWGDPDRFFAGLECYRKKKAPLLVFTRGQMPWSTGEPEGEALAREAKALGVSPKDILLTDAVENTADEATAVKKLFTQSQPTIILITSAYHMPRSLQLFKKKGFRIQPYPVDYKVDAHRLTLLDFLPTAEALRKTEWGVRELLGRLFYSILG